MKAKTAFFCRFSTWSLKRPSASLASSSGLLPLPYKAKSTSQNTVAT